MGNLMDRSGYGWFDRLGNINDWQFHTRINKLWIKILTTSTV
jgi:hypothetical protein